MVILIVLQKLIFLRKNDYKKLEIHLGYIQWLFPNYYTAGFNKDSFKLTADEARIFRENKEVKKHTILVFIMIF